MVNISVDELLEKVMLKLYKRWDAGILARLRPWLDEERLRLGTALRTLASAHVTQSEDAILLFLERLAGQEAIVSIAGEELEALGEVKQAVLRARRPSMKLRGHRPRTTNLSPARVQVLLVLLEAVEPPAYAVTRMFYPAAGEDLTELLEYVVIQTYGNWGRLALETRDAVLRTLNTVRAGMVREGEGYTVNVRNVVEALHQFEAMPETLYFARNAFLNGKIDAPPPSPPRLNSQAPITDRLAELLTNPPPLTGEPAPSDRRQGAPEPQRPEPPVQEPPAPEQPAPEPAQQAQPPQPQLSQIQLPQTPAPAEPAPPLSPGEQPAQALPVEELPPIVREATRPDPLRAEREFYTDVRFPQQVRVGEELPLIVRLTRAPYAVSRVNGEEGLDVDRPDQPEYVEVVVIAAGFNEGTATWSRSIAVYSDRDSQPAIFLLRAGRELGDKRVTIDFYHKARYLGSAAFVTRVVEQTPPAVAGVTVDTVGLVARFLETPPPPADLELRIVRGGSDNILNFMLHSTKAGIGYHWRPMGQVRLSAANPQAYLQTIFAHLSQLAAKPVGRLLEADALVDQGQLDAIGRQLFHELFPAELQHEYWTRIRPRRKDAANPNGSIATLLITSDEPWIPWEMVKPYMVNPDTGQVESDGFLSETFQVARWLAGRSLAASVQVQRAGLVVTGQDPVYTEREEAYFRNLTDRQVEVAGPLGQAAEVRRLAQEGGVQLLHLAAHGRRDAANDNLSPLSLEDGTLTPYDLAGAQVAGLRKERPLVFLNPCHTARLAFTLTGLGSWVERMVGDIGVSAFVGALWEVNDLLAAEFTIDFYNRLLAGDTLGQAFHAARLQVRDRQPANPTWLAYVLYGDPNSTVSWGSGEPVVEEPVEETPVEPEPEPEPQLDVDELRAMLEESLVGLLPELIRVGIPDAVAEAVQRLREQPERNRNGAHNPSTQETPEAAEAPPEPEPSAPPPPPSPTGGEVSPSAAG